MGLLEKIGDTEDEVRRLQAENEEFKQALINAGHALCALSNNGAGWWNDPFVSRHVRAIEKLTGHAFS
jgi:hypothetical protein